MQVGAGVGGIVNLAARGMLVVSVARRLGSEIVCSPIVVARSNGAGPQKGALGPLSWQCRPRWSAIFGSISSRRCAPEPLVRPRLIGSHQARVACNVRSEDGCQPAFGARSVAKGGLSRTARLKEPF